MGWPLVTPSGLYWLQFKRPHLMTYGFAVQPTAYGAFDQWGCEWATDMLHAEAIAKIWGEDCMIWRVPLNGAPYLWCRAGGTVERVDQIADLVLGA